MGMEPPRNLRGEDENVGRCPTMKALLTVRESMNLVLNVMGNPSQYLKKKKKEKQDLRYLITFPDSNKVEDQSFQFD